MPGPDSAFTQMERSRLIRYVTVLTLMQAVDGPLKQKRSALGAITYPWPCLGIRHDSCSSSGGVSLIRESVGLRMACGSVSGLSLLSLRTLGSIRGSLDGASLVPRRQALPTSTSPPLGREHAPLCSSRPDYQLWASYRSKASTGQVSSAPHAPHAGSSPLFARKTQNVVALGANSPHPLRLFTSALI
ncbi:hypothetical protein BDZ85DRAFT_43129 [Elsinoe ampelina]|uniref:Uncharacterized protein n=1 Tax=Elsinoe ampelina TaxID=302913 RepID=A0A6A6G1N0_9PEZI|nr:hypothetical protein BDZ85DRAFT_43129 [Elsinoe ampelina]